tara:strand:- start:581 stop:997 length:417 start_codon:yes stop_codon:yes gene_type:complete
MMIRLLSTLLLALFVTQALQAQPPANMQQRLARYRQLLQRFDVNKNGQLDPQERAVIRRIQAQQAGDNPQTRPQMQRPQNQTAAQPNANGQRRGNFQFQFRKRENKLDRTRLLNRFDTNGDGQLGADERAKAIEALAR